MSVESNMKLCFVTGFIQLNHLETAKVHFDAQGNQERCSSLQKQGIET